MGDTFANFQADMAAQSSAWVGHWVNIMVLVIVLGLPFVLIRKEARIAFIFIIAGMAGVFAIYAFHGYSRLLGLGHVIGWTPALIYLWSRRGNWDVRGSWFGKWALAASIVIAISLAFDYADVIRWLLGERG